jgi:signal transduction histidine kinase
MALRVPIRVKCAAALAVPLVMLTGVAGVEVAKSSREAAAVREQTDLATASIGPAGVVTALQNERNFTGLWLLGAEGGVDLPVDDLEEARAATDRAIHGFEEEVEAKGGEVERHYRVALQALDGLGVERALVDGYTGPRSVTTYNETAERSFAGYTMLVSSLAEPTSLLSYEVEDAELRTGVRLIDMASQEIDRIARFVRLALLRSVRDDGRISSQAEVREASTLQSAADREHLRILELAVGAYAPLGEELRVESEETQVRQIARSIVETGDIDVAGLLAGISIEDDESYYGFVDDVSGVLRDRADELNGAAQARQRALVAVAALVLLLAAVATPLLARSMTRPMRVLTREAQEMARRRLPDAVRRVHETPLGEDVTVSELGPIDVETRDEVADLADVLNQVQSTALDLAVEQAVLRHNVSDAFVNLARRNQNLLGRQLDFITELEQGEDRPDTLADLFRLDHQATRMRRYAESLLVLAGAGPKRHTSTPASIVDVVRAALGEVVDYQRVAMSDVRPATVVGPLVADLTHLLAELIENALRYSPPDVGVEVRGYHDRRGYELLVIDRGPGMSRAELDAANRRLAGAESLTIAPSQYLGHYVTAALAARHDLLVELMPNGLGLTARVGLPTDLLVDAHPIPTRAQRRGGWAGPVGLGADGLDHAGEAAPAWSVRIR